MSKKNLTQRRQAAEALREITNSFAPLQLCAFALNLFPLRLMQLCAFALNLIQHKEGDSMAAQSGQKTVTTAGTAVALGSQVINSPIMVKALDTNTGVVAIGNDGAGDVTVSNGLRLLAGDAVVFDFVGNLASIWVDSAVNGEGVAWLQLNA